MDIIFGALEVLGLVVLLGLSAACVLVLAGMTVGYVSEILAQQRRRRAARLEAQADVKAEQLRQTIYSLSERIAADRDEASREMTRVSFLTTGRVPPPSS